MPFTWPTNQTLKIIWLFELTYLCAQLTPYGAFRAANTSGVEPASRDGEPFSDCVRTTGWVGGGVSTLGAGFRGRECRHRGPSGRGCGRRRLGEGGGQAVQEAGDVVMPLIDPDDDAVVVLDAQRLLAH
jgi:hypothetical protein